MTEETDRQRGTEEINRHKVMSEISFGALFFIMIGMPVFIFWILNLNQPPSKMQMQRYVEQTHEQAVGVYPNAMTEKESDFFVVTEQDGTLYVDVHASADGLTHTSTQVEDGSDVAEMSRASIDRVQEEANAKLNKSKGSTRVMPIFLFR